MKLNLFFILLFALATSCSKEPSPIVSTETNFAKPSALRIYCEATPNELLRKVDYTYDGRNLVKERTTMADGELWEEKTYFYSDDGLLMNEVDSRTGITFETDFVYNDKQQLINRLLTTTNYLVTGEVESVEEGIATFEYENDLMVKATNVWGAWSTMEYDGTKLIKIKDFTKTGNLHHITTYSYTGSLIKKVRKETQGGNVLYDHRYIYNKDNWVSKIEDDGKTVEERKYDGNNREIEKRTYYYGIDPGFDVCLGNYIYKYDY